jgi:hypothetical protein
MSQTHIYTAKRFWRKFLHTRETVTSLSPYSEQQGQQEGYEWKNGLRVPLSTTKKVVTERAGALGILLFPGLLPPHPHPFVVLY